MLRGVMRNVLRRSVQAAVQDMRLCAGRAVSEPAHGRLCECYSLSTSSMAREGSAKEPEPPATSRVAVNRLLYRSRQRGFLEMDLLVGLFAERRLPQMSEAELVAFSAVLDQENPDLFKWLTGQEAPADDMLANPTFLELREHVKGQLAAHCAPSAASVPGKPWVRGWDDAGKQAAEPQKGW